MLDPSYQSELNSLRPSNEATSGSIPTVSDDPSIVHIHQPSGLAPNVGNTADELLPAYLQPFPSRIGPEELDLLQSKGAHLVPDFSFRNELLRSYLEYVHPSLPVLDLRDLFRRVEMNGRGSRVSLLLFQSVMFAGSAFAGEQHLLNAGFSDRKQVRRFFFQKIKVHIPVFHVPDSSTHRFAGAI